MKYYKRLSQAFTVLAVLLSIIMCVHVAYDFFTLLGCCWCSAPAWVAFLFCIPYGIGIAICAALARFLRKKHQKTA